MSEHTPTPWRVTIINGKNYIQSTRGPIDVEANAQLIVKACNAHEGLIKELRLIVIQCACQKHTDGINPDKACPRCGSAIDILEKATT